MNNLYFACTDCRIFIDAGYRWAYWNLVAPAVVAMRGEVEVDRVLNTEAYWTPPREPNSDWLYKDVLPSVRTFFSDHLGHRIVFWDSNDLPEDYLFEWIQVGYCPSPTARFFAETLRLRDWDAVLQYDRTVGDGALEILLYNDEQADAFRRAFYRWAEEADRDGGSAAT